MIGHDFVEEAFKGREGCCSRRHISLGDVVSPCCASHASDNDFRVAVPLIFGYSIVVSWRFSGFITGCNVWASLTNLTNSVTSLVIHSSLGDAKATLHVRGLPSDVRCETGASASTSGVSPVMTIASVEVRREWEGGTR